MTAATDRVAAFLASGRKDVLVIASHLDRSGRRHNLPRADLLEVVRLARACEALDEYWRGVLRRGDDSWAARALGGAPEQHLVQPRPPKMGESYFDGRGFCHTAERDYGAHERRLVIVDGAQ